MEGTVYFSGKYSSPTPREELLFHEALVTETIIHVCGTYSQPLLLVMVSNGFYIRKGMTQYSQQKINPNS